MSIIFNKGWQRQGLLSCRKQRLMVPAEKWETLRSFANHENGGDDDDDDGRVIIPNVTKTEEIQRWHHHILSKLADTARQRQSKVSRNTRLSDLKDVSSMLEYLTEKKGYDFEHDDDDDDEVLSYEAYKVVVSNVHSHPLTLASVWEEMGLAKIDHPRVCIVGSEVELNLNLNWGHLTDLTQQETILHFVTPYEFFDNELNTIPQGDPDDWVSAKHKVFEEISASENNRLELSLSVSRVEDLERNLLDSMDAFVAFMPGAGTNPTYTWEAAFRSIRETERPLLLTAYDYPDDYKRDARFWKENFGKRLIYRKNPFATPPVPLFLWPDFFPHRYPPINGYLCVVKPE